MIIVLLFILPQIAFSWLFSLSSWHSPKPTASSVLHCAQALDSTVMGWSKTEPSIPRSQRSCEVNELWQLIVILCNLKANALVIDNLVIAWWWTQFSAVGEPHGWVCVPVLLHFQGQERKRQIHYGVRTPCGVTGLEQKLVWAVVNIYIVTAVHISTTGSENSKAMSQ